MHRQTQHGVDKGELSSEGNKKDRGDDPRTYILMFTAREGPRLFPAKGCNGRV